MALLTFKEAARIANKSVRTIERWCYEEQSLLYSKPSDGYGGNTPMVDEFDLMRRLGRHPTTPTDDDARRQTTTPNGDTHWQPTQDVLEHESPSPPATQEAAERGAEQLRLIIRDRDERHAAALSAMQEAFTTALADMDRRHTTHDDDMTRQHSADMAVVQERVVDAERRAALAEAEAARLRTELDSRTRTDTDGRPLWRRVLGLE